MRLPGLDHPISVEPVAAQVTVAANQRIVARSDNALVLREAKHPPVYYLPVADVEPGALRRSQTHTHCPFKGRASYYDVVGDGTTVSDAGWTYEDPYDGVAAIRDHVAFYPSKVTIDVAEA